MNILDKHSPNAAGTNNTACAQSSAPPSSGSTDCLIPNSQLIPSLAAPPSSAAPSSVSSSSAPHTPIDTLNSVNCQPDLTLNGHSSRPNASTPSSVFNNSAPNTPMPCPSVGSDANITSPALSQLDYGDQKLFNPGPSPLSSQALVSNSGVNNSVLSPLPLNVPPPLCNDIKNKSNSNSSNNKKHCNNRNQNNQFANLNVTNNSDRNITCENSSNKKPVNYSNANNMPNMPMPCMQNSPQLNGHISPFDVESKMPGFINEFSSPISNGALSQMPNMPVSRAPNCSANMNMPMQPNMMNASSKMCGGNMANNSAMKSQMDSQYMQQQSQIFVFNTFMANQSAEAVDSNQFLSIIDFHLAHPLTKKFLDKHSLKIQSFSRPNAWMGNIRQPRIRTPNPNNIGVRANFNPCFGQFNHNPTGPGPGGGPQWNMSNNWQHQPQGYPPNDMNMKMNNCAVRPYGPQFNNNFHPNSPSCQIGNSQSIDLQDDNLTPQQKIHREKQLAILANLQQKFCPELMESNNRLTSQPPQSNEFINIDPNSNHCLISENEQLNSGISPDPSLNFNSNYPPTTIMNNQPSDQWQQKSSTFVDEKQFNGRRKTSQGANQSNLAHQSPLSQQSINSPNSCVTQSPGNRVPPPPYNQSLRSISSPHPTSPASLSLSSPRMQTTDSRQPNYSSSSVRSCQATPTDNSNCALVSNSPKSSQNRANSSPGNKKIKSSSIDTEMGLMNSFSSKSEPALMPVPSPKQIDYINSFEGQELTIQKQRNAHFQEIDLLNSNDLSNELFPNDFANMCPSVNNTSNMAVMNQNMRFPANSQPCNYDPNMKFSGPERFNGPMMDGFKPPVGCSSQFSSNDPNMRFSNCDSNLIKPRLTSPADIRTFSSPNSMGDMNFSAPLQTINNDVMTYSNGSNHNYNDHAENPMGSTHLQNLQKMVPPFDIPTKDGMIQNSKSNISNSNNNPMVPSNMHPNIPQNQNPRMPNFDQSFPNNMPCNELNESNNFSSPNMHQSGMPMNYPNNFNNPPRMSANMPNDSQFGMHSNNSFPGMPMNAPTHQLLDQNIGNGSNMIPMMPGPGQQGNFRFSNNINRPMNPSNTHGPRYNSPNIQVKPDAPNTIQYLPSRPQGPINTPPNRPPNLDFLQQSLNMNNKPPSNNNSYFPNNSPGMPMPPRQMQPSNFGRPSMIRQQNPHMPPNSQPMCHPGNEMFIRQSAPNMINGPNSMNHNIPMTPQNNFGSVHRAAPPSHF